MSPALDNLVEVTADQIRSGEWVGIAKQTSRKEGIALTTIEPEPSEEADLAKAVSTIIANNGTYQEGDRAIIHLRYGALPAGLEFAHQLQEMGIEVMMILGYDSVLPELIS